MILKSFGCSFIYGTDLADMANDDVGPNSLPSRSTWPSLLAQDLGYEYQSHARPGSGNLRILEKVLSQATDSTSAIFVIGWSWIDRYDYTVDFLSDRFHIDRVGRNLWRTVTPGDTSTTAQVYYRDLHSQYRDKLTSLTYIKTAIDTLKEKNISFIMTYVDELLFETQWHTNSSIEYLQEYIRPHMTTFEGQTFLEWSKKKGFPISETLHPLESAHQAGFELIKSYKYKQPIY